MWAAVSFSLVTVGTAFVVAGPIVALVMTILVSATLLLTTDLMRRRALAQANGGTLTIVKAVPGQASSLLERKAS